MSLSYACDVITLQSAAVFVIYTACPLTMSALLPPSNRTANAEPLLQAYASGQTVFPHFSGRYAALGKAFLPFIQLEDADLRQADLRESVLPGANLLRARLQAANLNWANLIAADLIRADLQEASLKDALLCSANLCGANLSYADLQESSFAGAILNGASFRGANLRGANLNGASLVGTNFKEADLSGADLDNATLNYTIMPDGSCIIGHDGHDEGTHPNGVALANIAAYSRLAAYLKRH